MLSLTHYSPLSLIATDRIKLDNQDKIDIISILADFNTEVLKCNMKPFNIQNCVIRNTIQNHVIRNTITFSTLSTKWQLIFTNQCHKFSVNIRNDSRVKLMM